MKLWIGGAYQGQNELALLSGGQNIEHFCSADGATDDYGKAFLADVIVNFHEYIRRLEADGHDVDSFVNQLLQNEPCAVSMNEIGCGIVPMDAFLRVYRESVGRAGTLLAKHADHVYRVSCGIPMKIK